MKKINKKRGCLKFFAFPLISRVFIILFALILSSQFLYATTSDEYKPYLHKPSVGDVPKLETFGEFKTELFPGVGTYVYNIIVPLGAQGLQPSISLIYNSQSVLQRPCILGAGWSLTENYVMRHVNYSIDDTSDDYFILAMNNNRYKLLYNGSSYNTEIDPHKLRIENLTNAGKQYWRVTTADGTQYRFGYNSDSLLESNTGKDYDIKYSLDLIEDIHDNKIEYTYLENPNNEDKGAVYLANITYNNDELKVISFSYENQVRPDRRLVYEQGNLVEESRRLSDIYVYFNNSLVRKYSLAYDNLNDEKSLSALASITYIGSDDSSVLNTIQLEYYETMQGFDNTTGNWVVPGGFAFSSKDATGKDLGVRLLDVNNDGFPDLVKAKDGTHETRLNNKVNGWNSASSILVIPDGVDITSSNLDQGVRFADVNSDGLIDILKAKGGGTRNVYLNNGTGWNDASSVWNLSVDFIDGGSKDLGVRLVDFNGDGKIDILRAQALGTNISYINNGSGWENTSDWVIPDFFVTSDNKDNGLRILDLNNDGLPDLVKGGKPGNAWLNNDSGWVNNSVYAPDLEFTDHDDRPDLGVRFMELNGDGLVDLIQNFFSNVSKLNQTCYNETGSEENCTYYNVSYNTNTKINNGTGWIAGIGWISPERFTSVGYNIGRRIADVNGDGYPDIVVAYQNSPFENITHIKDTKSAFLLKQITNTYGGKTKVVYKQSTLSDNGDDLGFNIWVVGNTSLNNSVIEDFQSESKYSYLYADGKFDYDSLEFRGFGSVNETLPDNSIISHFFHQDAILKGREYQTSTYDTSGKHIKDDINNFTYSFDNMVYLNKTSSQIYDGEPTPVVSNISYEYDFYGNIKEINKFGDVEISGDEKFEVFNYVYNTTNFVVDKPVNYTLFDSDSITVVKQVFYFYDNQTTGVSLGDLTKVKRFNDHGEDPEVEYVYDSFGNVISKIDALGYTTSYVYESTGVLRIKETNDLGHVIDFDYDLGTGNLLSEERDGLSKNFEYDIFGRITKEAISPDTLNSPTKNYTYDFDGIAPEMIKLETKNNDSDYSESIYVYDGFGNVIQIKLLFDDGNQIIKNYFYDSKYRIKEEQNPYFDSYSSGLSSPFSGVKIKYNYDALDRVINLTKQDNNSIIVVFNRTTISQFDENNNRIDYILDSHDRIINVLEYNSDEVYNTTYTYKTDDNLRNITDAKGNLFIFEYDSLGRKISFDDPNMDEWTYAYDLNGNLINQTDGRNLSIIMAYDSLNRVTKKSSDNSTIDFGYDIQYNGTLANTTLSNSQSDPIYHRYEYDGRLRIVKEAVFIPIRRGIDHWINVSVDYDSSDRILNMYLPNNNLSYEYNSIGKIKNIQNFLDSINYNAFGKITNKTFTNNIVTEIDYDDLNRISQLNTDTIQDLRYTYDGVGNIDEINDTVNSKLYTMDYDNLNRLTATRIYDFTTYEHEKFVYNYDEIGNILSTTSDTEGINFTYGSLAHAPTQVTKYDRDPASIELDLVDPSESTNVNQYEFFNYTTQVCCRDNDCWGINVSLDPEDGGFTPSTETHCEDGICTKTIYSGIGFVYEDDKWKKIENARSLKDVWGVIIYEDPNFPAKVVDFNYTSITLNLSVSSKWKLLRGIPLSVYNKLNKSEMPKDEAGNVVDKDRTIRFAKVDDEKTVTIDLSDTIENLLTQEIKWGDDSTLIIVHDTDSENMDDSYIRDSSYSNNNYGSEPRVYIRNSSTSNMRTLIRFNISHIPRHALIENAELFLYLSGNYLDTGESYNVSSYHLFHSYNWSEDTVTWNTRPNSSDYNHTFTDDVYIFGGAGRPLNEYFSWNVTQIIKQKNMNESFYFYARYNNGGEPTDYIYFHSKESPSTNKPYLNVTYLLKGLIPMNSSETPFYTTVSNPYFVDLEQDECQNITWYVNATGDKRDYLFFTYANKTANGSINGVSDVVDITIV